MSLPALGIVMLLSGAPVDSEIASAEAPFVFAMSAAGAPAAIPATDSVLPVQMALAEPAAPSAPEAAPPDDHDEIVVRARSHAPPGDPVQALNLATFQVTQAVDEAVVRPVAMAYSRIIPDPIRDGVRNVLNNLTEPVVFVNFLLQHKIGKAAETLGRFVINSTIGVVGIFDFAKRKPIKLPHRKNGFAYTMGFYGVKPGAFLFLPLVGPTTVRDLIGVVLDRAFVPFAFGKPFNRPAYAIPATVFSQLDQRDQFDEEIQARHLDARGAYAATREDYLQDRQAAIDELRGKKPAKAPEPILAPLAQPRP